MGKICPNHDKVKGKNEYDRRRKQDICIYTIKPAVKYKAGTDKWKNG